MIRSICATPTALNAWVGFARLPMMRSFLCVPDAEYISPDYPQLWYRTPISSIADSERISHASTAKPQGGYRTCGVTAGLSLTGGRG